MRKSVDTGYQPREQINPWDEGDYRIYGGASQRPDGSFAPTYYIVRLNGIPDAPKIAVENHLVDFGSFNTSGEAALMGVSHGVERVRSGRDLLY